MDTGYRLSSLCTSLFDRLPLLVGDADRAGGSVQAAVQLYVPGESVADRDSFASQFVGQRGISPEGLAYPLSLV